MSVLRTRVEEAFEKIRKAFPFENYIDEATFHEVLPIVQQVSRFLPTFESARLLDVGSGPMDKTGVFQALGFACHAVDDLSDPWHTRGDNTLRILEYAEKLGIEFFHQQRGTYVIPFERESFDVVCTLSVIEHLHESPRELLNTMGTFLKTGGLLVVAMPNSVNLRKRLSVLFGKTNYVPVDQFFHSTGTWRGHVREYTQAETVYICRECGFEILSEGTFEAIAHTRLKSPLRQMYLLLCSLVPSIRSGVLVICRKPVAWMPREHDPEVFRSALARGVPQGVA